MRVCGLLQTCFGTILLRQAWRWTSLVNWLPSSGGSWKNVPRRDPAKQEDFKLSFSPTTRVFAPTSCLFVALEEHPMILTFPFTNCFVFLKRNDCFVKYKRNISDHESQSTDISSKWPCPSTVVVYKVSLSIKKVLLSFFSNKIFLRKEKKRIFCWRFELIASFLDWLQQVTQALKTQKHRNPDIFQKRLQRH